MQFVDKIQGNQSFNFKALKIKNPDKMPSEMLKALNEVKEEFNNFPYASVELKNKNWLGFNTFKYGCNTKRRFGRFFKSSLIFDLGNRSSNKKAGKFYITSNLEHSTSLYDGFFERMIRSLPLSVIVYDHNCYNATIITKQITKNNISEKIKNLKNSSAKY